MINADDAKIVDKCWSKDESNIVKLSVKPILALLIMSASTDKVDQLIMKAMTSFSTLLLLPGV